jgi:peptidoglycan/LPS O-acetylase OafA/YrhL
MLNEDLNTISISKALRGSYYNSLNGFRGVSIILVVCYHLRLFHGPITYYVFNGRLGVGIFFVLSGFLITTLCLKEIERTGSLALRSFYTRRVLRIFPVAYLYLLVIIILNHIYQLNIPAFQFAGAALYIMNFSYFRSHDFTYIIAHYWTLSVEEQFYILFPVILKLNRKAFFNIVAFIIFALPVIYSIQTFFPVLNTGILYFFVHYFLKFQCIAVGCLFAVLAYNGFFDRAWLSKTKILGNVIAIFLIFYLDFEDFYTVRTTYINAIISILIGYLIITNLLQSRDYLFRFLNSKLISFIGVLSYSIYIWHMLFVAFERKLPPIFSQMPYNIPGIIIVPLLSHYLFEKYFLNLKKRFARVK